MRRRNFITLFGGAAVGWPLVVCAQQSDRPKLVGVLFSGDENDPIYPARQTLIRQSLQGLGWTEGHNLRIEFRFGSGNIDRIRLQAAELVRLLPDAILTVGTHQLQAVAQESRTIPIVGVQVGDLVGLGLVASLSHPGGNVTGFMESEFEIGGKWLETLKEIAPLVNHVMVLNNPKNLGSSAYERTLETVALSLGIRLARADIDSAADIERVCNEFAHEPNGGVVVIPDVLTFTHREMIASLMIQQRLPAVYAFRPYASSGGLVSYGTDTNDLVRRAAVYLNRILKGEKPGELPIQEPTKYELVINLKAAKAIGIIIPPSLLARADEVIE